MLDFRRPKGGAPDLDLFGVWRRPGWTRWSAHVLFWLAYFLMRSAAAAAEPPKEMTEFPFLANRAVMVGIYALVTGLLLALAAGPRADRSDRARNLLLILGALAVSPITYLAEESSPRLFGMAPSDPFPFFAYLFVFGWVLPLWALTQALLGYHFKIMAQQRAITRAQALAHDAQLRMLHYQINPHFLFNTLNAISTLVLDKRTDQAERMLMGLSGFLRYSLDRRPNELAPLSAELEAQRRYLEIEQTRFGDKLTVNFDIEPGLQCVRLPSLILQPILENAIKYAITPSADGGRIEVSARREGALLRVRVDDDGPGIEPDATRRRRGVGLANALERLKLVYGDEAGLSVANREPRGCRAEMWLPMQEESSARAVAPTFS